MLSLISSPVLLSPHTCPSSPHGVSFPRHRTDPPLLALISPRLLPPPNNDTSTGSYYPLPRARATAEGGDLADVSSPRPFSSTATSLKRKRLQQSIRPRVSSYDESVSTKRLKICCRRNTETVDKGAIPCTVEYSQGSPVPEIPFEPPRLPCPTSGLDLVTPESRDPTSLRNRSMTTTGLTTQSNSKMSTSIASPSSPSSSKSSSTPSPIHSAPPIGRTRVAPPSPIAIPAHPVGSSDDDSESPRTATMPPAPSSLKSHSFSHSSQTLPPFLTMKRSNPKKLSLSLFVPPTPTSSSSTTTVDAMDSQPSSTESTPYTPGPPKTPALAMSAMSMSVGRAATKNSGRPSLLSLITRNESTDDAVPPTPGGARKMVRPKRVRAQSNTTTSEPYPMPSGSRTAHPTSMTFPPISETDDSPDFSIIREPRNTTPTSMSTSVGSSSSYASTSSTPATTSSPPMATTSYFKQSSEPYSDGPVELISGIYLGSEESTFDLSWSGEASRVRILNVASEIDDPFAKTHTSKDKGKAADKIWMRSYEGKDGPDIDYCHLAWSHGEERLAKVPETAKLDDVHVTDEAHDDSDSWAFWQAIRWIETARRQCTPVLIHCQCGVSRSATLAIAYLMTLAAAGTMPDVLGHLKGMQDTYDMVKRKSPSIGPNVSLVFQLVEYQRNLTSLLSSHYASPSARNILTSFPTAEAVALSEAEWARKRREFEDGENDFDGDDDMTDMEGGRWCGVLGSPISPEEAGVEAKRWDEAMIQRRMARA